VAYDYFIGIDPGVSGAIALICDDDQMVWDIPTINIELTTKTKNGNKKKRNVLDLSALTDRIEEWNFTSYIFAVIEKVSSSPQMGVASSFNFGYAFGACEMLIASKRIAYELVTPNKWKKAVGLRVKAEKDESRLHAIKLFPDMRDQLRLKKDHNKAEALLLAEYARRIQSGT